MSLGTPVPPTDNETEVKADYGIKGKVLGFVHSNTVLNRRAKVLRDEICSLIPIGDKLNGVDIGCGNGILGLSISNKRPEVQMTGVDVHIWPKTVIPVTKYDGDRLPFEDKSVDFAILSDVLHHCEAPEEVLREAARISRQFIIIKDHLCESQFDFQILKFMDWFGNKGYGVALPYKYFSDAEWQKLFADIGLRPEETNTKVPLYPFPFNLLFGRKLHFVSRLSVQPQLKRESVTSGS